MKLNLGCGRDIRAGYVNVDFNPWPGVDLVADFTRLPLADRCASEIVAQDILEHISWREVKAVLGEWRRLLRPGGRLWIRTPDLEGMVRLYRERPPGWRREDGEAIGIDPIVDRLYGGQDYRGNFHYVIFDKPALSALLVELGFTIADAASDGEDISNMCVAAYTQPMLARHGDIAPDTLRVSWEGPLFGPSGYATAARAYVRGLDAVGVRVRAQPLWGDCKVSFDDDDIDDDEADGCVVEALFDGVRRTARLRTPVAPEQAARLAELSLVPAGGTYVMHHPPASAEGKDFVAERFSRNRSYASRVVYTAFETDRIPAPWVDALAPADEVWVPSHFNLETFVRSGVARERVHVIPHAFDPAAYRPDETEPLRFGEAAGFTFLSIFEWTERKGWDVLLRAYLDAFRAEDDVRLLIRAYQGGGVTGDAPPLRQQLVEFVRDELHRDPARIPRIELIERMVPAHEMPALYRAGDAFVLPTRGEGWGLPLSESLLMRRPVIATRWSGHLEFLDDDNAYLVDVERLVPVGERQQRDNPLYAGHMWAEPSAAHLAELMRRVVSERDVAEAKAERGRAQIIERFSEARVGALVAERLAALAQPRRQGKGARGHAKAQRRKQAKRTRRVLLQARPTVFSAPGGDSEVVRETQRALEARGHQVDFSSDAALDVSGYDLVHVVNAEEPFALNAARQQVPFVCTVLYEDQRRYLPRSMATISAAQRALASGETTAARFGELLDETYGAVDALFARAERPGAERATFITQHAAALTASGEREARRIETELRAVRAVDVVRVGFSPPALDDIDAPSAARDFVERFGVEDFVLCVGRLENRKNQLTLLAALADEDVPLVFVDSQTPQPAYAELCKRWPRRAPTIFTGRISRAELHGAFRAARVHALPSWFELPGLVTLEAAWHGVNVVAGSWGTVAEYMGDNVFLCEPDDLDSVRAA
ncbi:MAG: glycosyltransferase, partial [Myxococcales bacterium]|nr:glycosyltransferase [Myxococcales bacterium]